MPNWSYNRIYFVGSEKQVLDFAKVALSKSSEKIDTTDVSLKNVCELLESAKLTLDSFNPMPKTFKEWDTTNDKLKRDYLDYHKKPQEIVDEIGKVVDKIYPPYFSSDEEYEKYSKGYDDAVKYQKETYGVVGWYDWGCLYRGTKWDAMCENWEIIDNGNDKVALSFSCDTAWSLPTAWLDFMQKTYDYLSIYVFAEEESRAYFGYIDFNNNVTSMLDDCSVESIMNEDCPELSNDTDEYYNRMESIYEDLRDEKESELINLMFS